MNDQFTLPHSVYTERALLGAMILFNEKRDVVFSTLKPDYFYKDSHKKIAEAILSSGETFNLVTLGESLTKSGSIKSCGGYEYLSGLIDGIPTNFDISTLIDEALEAYKKRELLLNCLGVIKAIQEPRSEIGTLYAGLEETIIESQVGIVSPGFRKISAIMPKAVERIESAQKSGKGDGILTGLTELDLLTAGFFPGNLIVIAGRPSHGKTALACSIMPHIIKAGKKIGFFSIEMTEYEIGFRLTSLVSGIPVTCLKTGKKKFTNNEWNEIGRAENVISDWDLFIDATPEIKINELCSRAKRLKRESGLDILFVDYLQLIRTDKDQVKRNDSRDIEVALISSKLKSLAKTLEIPVVALCQLNRGPETRSKSGARVKYVMSDLRESGAIEQDADLIIFCHRDEVVDTDSSQRKGEADLILAKHRDGQTGHIVTAFQKPCAKFVNIGFDDYDDSYPDSLFG